MISFLKKIKANELKAKHYKLNAGMTYVELIVVLSIFATLTSVVLFNYGNFQARVDIKNLASDIALQIVQAQKSAIAGALPPTPRTFGNGAKPAYGMYFNIGTGGANLSADSTHFIYFADLDNSKTFDGSTCSSIATNEECLSQYSITKNNTISDLSIFSTGVNCPNGTVSDLTITFKRPDSGATITSSNYSLDACTVSYVQVTIVDAKGNNSTKIKLYAPGRIQIN